MPAKFVGHPLFEHEPDYATLDKIIAQWPSSGPRIALMPGSRPGEIRKCFPLILAAFRRVKGDIPSATGVIPITQPEVVGVLQALAEEHGGWVEGMHVVPGNTDAVVRWCDVALVASGTVTLQVARQIKPMVTFYRMGNSLRLPFDLFGGMVFKTKHFTLPNLIAGREAVTELVPYFGEGHELAVGLYRLLRQPGCADGQRDALTKIVQQFKGYRCGELAADVVERIAGMRP